MATQAPRVPLKTVLLPAEHGGWGLTLEPVVLGLLVAPSLAGAGLGVAALFAFLARTPLRMVLADYRKGKRFPRTPLAERAALAYLAVALAGLGVAVMAAAAPFWGPLLLAAPLALVQLAFDARNRGRHLVPELAGAAAMGAVAAAIVLAGGGAVGVALGAWLVLAVRAGMAIGFARVQVRRARGQAARAAGALAAQGAGVLALGLAAALGLVPWLSVAAGAALGGYAFLALSRPPVPARVVGWTQIAFGLVMVLCTAAGYRLGA